MKASLGICFVLMLAFQSQAQINKDSLLANERTLDRPLNVHGGQLRVTGEYGFSFINKRFDVDGNSDKLKKDGQARGLHTSYINLKYGILEHLQFSAQLGYQTQSMREKQIFIVGFPDINGSTVINGVHEVAGLEDAALGLDFRIPFKTRKIDLITSVDVLLPIGEHEQARPSHELTEAGQNWEIQYNNKSPVTNGVMAYRLGGAIKYRGQNVAFTLMGDFTKASKETTQLDWDYQLNAQQQFEYSSTRYKVSPADQIRITGSIEYQANPFFNIYFSGSVLQMNNGWFELDGVKIKADDRSLFTMGPGFELIITPRIWFRETVSIPVAGKSNDAGVQFVSSLSYNLFVKH
jgi:hypothetical protein